MKCPKCSYLGFETGDRCKNCGYDFSLVTDPSGPGDIDLTFRSRDDSNSPVSPQWDDTFDVAPAASPSSPDVLDPVRPASEAVTAEAESVVGEPAGAAPATAEAERTDRTGRLPLFTQAFDDFGDEPLIRLPSAPRPPLAVRRTPRRPRLRTAPRASRSFAPGPELEFGDIVPETPAGESVSDVIARIDARLATQPPPQAEASGAARRLGAAVVDHLLLSAVDLSVIYLTLRMAGLSMAEWAALPPLPLAAFLLFVKLSYFCAFTAVGGQTIGKMAARIRVVTTADASVDGSRAVKRAFAGAISAALLGLGYLPALVGSEHRALHDRVTETRVIALPSI